MIVNVDLHIHSCFSQAASKHMVIPKIATCAKSKGLDIVGTGDALHPRWLKMIKENTECIDEGIYRYDECNFVITVEIEDMKKVHHLAILPSIETAEDIIEEISSDNLMKNGRPHLSLNGAEIMDLVHDHDGIIGPAHAFTPWTSLYKTYYSYKECYGKKPDFLELGLSADTNMADRIEELQDIVFLTNSDAHSPWPHRLGREFNRLKLDDFSYTSLKKSIKKKKIEANYGMDPRLGKYHLTACSRCHKVFDYETAVKLKMRCICGGIIKKGVDYRISEIATWEKPHHPPHRPPYIYILPLTEIISKRYGKGINTKFVWNKWKEFIDNFGNEIKVLLEEPIYELEKVDRKVALGIKAFRNNELIITPGGGGKYGEIQFPGNTLDAYIK